ncbi:MAG: hypothetical protein EA392_02275 [Cryomorphaceae bacterium]|nr:MAG: hypothetical protein EA392_02275 [Cryomorphaceae bacterium]
MYKPVLFVLAATLCAGEATAQKIGIRSNPENAYVISKGTSTVKKTFARIDADDRVFVYAENYIPAVFEPPQNNTISVDLVPVLDLLGAAQTPMVDFTKFKLSMKPMTQIGAVGVSDRPIMLNTSITKSIESNLEGWQNAMKDVLISRNINVKVEDTKSDLFETGGDKRSEKARYLLGGEITDIWISVTKLQAHAVMEISWALYDRRVREVIFETRSYGFGKGSEQGRDHWDDSFKNAAENLAADDNFIGFLMTLDTDVTIEGEGEHAFEDMYLSPATPLSNLSGSGLIKRCIESSVTILREDGAGGSGFLISTDGKIITNKHVVGEHSKVEVVLSNGLRLPAEVSRVAEDADLALVELEMGSGFKPLPLALGDESAFDIGDDVFAIGTPLAEELGQTVSKGMVSGKRVFDNKKHIQTNMSVNRGNSGGPLLNLKGEVIGVVTWKIGGDSVEGLSFAIPVDEITNTLNIRYR